MTSPSKPVTGLILRVDAKVCHVDVDGRTLQLPLRGKLFERPSRERRPVAVGDRVILTLDGELGAIEAVLPRTSKLARRAAGQREQVIAANVGLVLIASSIADPPFHPGLVDRILASCERQQLPAAIIVTKLDLDRDGASAEWVDLYRGLGYRVFGTSLQPPESTADDLAALAEALRTNVSVITGLSGVGKSALLNHLVPGLDLRIGSMSRIRQGKHTTSHTELIRLPGGGHVLDTPGIHGFGLFGVDPHEITFYFRELAPLARDCAFRDCTHLVEDDCAVQRALEAGEIHPSRFASYAELVEELAGEEEP